MAERDTFFGALPFSTLDRVAPFLPHPRPFLFPVSDSFLKTVFLSSLDNGNPPASASKVPWFHSCHNTPSFFSNFLKDDSQRTSSLQTAFLLGRQPRRQKPRYAGWRNLEWKHQYSTFWCAQDERPCKSCTQQSHSPQKAVGPLLYSTESGL